MMEGFSTPPTLTPADFTDESDRYEIEKDIDLDNVSEVSPYLFEPVAETRSAAVEG